MVAAIDSAWGDDFDNGPGISGSSAWGTQRWQANLANGGTITSQSSHNNPGQWVLATGGGSSSGRSSIFRGGSTTGNIYLGTDREQYVEFLFQVPTVSAAGQTFDSVIGLGDQPNTDGVGQNGVYLRVNTSNVLQCQLLVAGVVSPLSLTTATTLTAGSWVRFRLASDKTNLLWQVGTGRNGALSTIHTVALSSLPAGILTAPLGPLVKIQKVAGSGNRSINVDYARGAS